MSGCAGVESSNDEWENDPYPSILDDGSIGIESYLWFTADVLVGKFSYFSTDA